VAGPNTEAMNADTAPEPQPTSTQTNGLQHTDAALHVRKRMKYYTTVNYRATTATQLI